MSTYKLTDMNLFSLVEEGQVIICTRGVYRQVGLYQRGEKLFAAVKDGFVQLLARENTTVPFIRWKAIEGVNFVEEWNGPQIAPVPVKKTKLKVAK